MWTAFFFSGLARWVALGGAVALAIGGLYVKGRIDGNNACKAAQQVQMERMENYVKGIRERIERNLPIDDSILRADPFQREP